MPTDAPSSTPHASVAAPLWDLADIAGILRRRWPWLLVFPALAVAAAVAYSAATPREYAAKTTLVLDPRGLQVVERELTPTSQNSTISLAVVESQISVMTSDTVLREVVRSQALVSDPEFGGGAVSVLGYLKAALRSLAGGPRAAGDAEIDTLNALRRAVRAERVTNSYVIDLFVKSRDAGKAARLANAIAAAYIAQERADRSETNQRASAGLSRQLADLRKRVQAAERDVEAYKKANNILSVGSGLVNEQQIAELTNQIVTARVEASRAQARFEQISAMLRSGGAVDATGESIQSPTIAQLRVRLAAARQNEAGLLVSLRPAHPAVRSAQARVATIGAQIRGELKRIAEAARSDMERASANERQLIASLDGLKDRAETTNAARVQLRELERAAAANRSVYESFLVRAKEIAGQKEVDTSNARIVTPAVPPRDALGPGLGLLLAGALLVGLGGGAVTALLREQVSSKGVLEVPTPRFPSRSAGTKKRSPREAAEPGRGPVVGRAVSGVAPTREVRVSRSGNPARPTARAASVMDIDLRGLVRTRGQTVTGRGIETKGKSVPAGSAVVTPIRSNVVAMQPGRPARDDAGAFERAIGGYPLHQPLHHVRFGDEVGPSLAATALARHTDDGVAAADIDVIAEVDAAQMRGRVVASTVLDDPGARGSRPYLSMMRTFRKKRGIRKSLTVLVMAPERHLGSAHVALNLASAAVLQEENVLLVDADARARRLTRTLTPDARSGISEVARGDAKLDDVVWRDPETFDVLPVGPGGKAPRAGTQYRGLFAEARQRYTMVVVDGGTLGSHSLGARLAAASEYVLLVVCTKKGETDLPVALPDQIRLQGTKVLGAIALVDG